MNIADIKLGERYWCIVKISTVDESEREKPEFMVHILRGYVTVKGVQLKDGAVVPFVEIAKQQLRTDLIFEYRRDAVEEMSRLMAEMQAGIKALPPVA